MDDLFLKLLDAFVELIESGEKIPDELFEEMTALLLDYIQRAQAGKQVAPVGAPELPKVNQAEYPSSNIYGFNFDPKSKRLLIKFMGKDTAESGPVYEYEGVPPHIFEVLKRGAVAPKTTGKNKYHAWYKGKTPSHGASVYALVKEANYPYQKVA